jgi:hypothetical protein
MTTDRKNISLAGLGLVFGAAFGLIAGYAVGNVGLGIALGAALGILFAPTIKRKPKPA